MRYRVKFEIDVNADTPHDAALQVEKTLMNLSFRPHLVVTDALNKSVEIDLDKEPTTNSTDPVDPQ